MGQGGTQPELVIRCVKDRRVVVRLVDRHLPGRPDAGFGIVVEGPGMRASLDDDEFWVWDDDLGRFLGRLAADPRGWYGERIWGSSHLSLRAVCHPGARVSLTWTLRPWLYFVTWEASVTVWHEAGAQLAALAADVRRFLHLPIG